MLRASVITLLLASAVHAQPGQIYACIGFYLGRPTIYSGSVYRIPIAGGAATSLLPAPLAATGVEMDLTNRHIIATNYGPLARIDTGTGMITTTGVGGRELAPHQDGGYVTSGGGWFSVADKNLGLVANWYRYDLVGASAVVQDAWTGDYFVSVAANSSLDGIYRVSTDGRTFLKIARGTFHDLVQNHVDGALYATDFFGITKITAAGSQSVVSNAGLSFGSLDVIGGLGTGELVVMAWWNGGTVSRVRRDGTIVSQGAVTNLPTSARVVHSARVARGRHVATERLASGNRFAIRVSFPQDAGRRYVVGLSAAGFTPGVPIAGRTIPLTLDGAFLLSVTGGLGSLLRNAAGTLNANGAATATLDLSRYGSQLRGKLLWIAAAALAPGAPGGVATISKAVVLKLE